MMQAHIRNGLTRKELMAEVFLEMIAGSDSTATAVRMTMLCLMTTPASLRALQHEIDAGVTAGRISSPVTDAEAYQLPYLQAVIKEGLRMFPPSTGHNYKEVPKGGSEIRGYYLPGGTQVGINIQQMMRDKGKFGPDADVFRPERWIEAAKDEETYKEMAATVDLAFGHGKFQCLGKVIAAMELNKVFVEVSPSAVLPRSQACRDEILILTMLQLLRRYDFAVVNPVEPMKLFDAAFWVANDFYLRVTSKASAR